MLCYLYQRGRDAKLRRELVCPYGKRGAGINAMAPIAGNIQVRAPAGSVFIQDTRTWCTLRPPLSNTSAHSSALACISLGLCLEIYMHLYKHGNHVPIHGIGDILCPPRG
jgi:hypothetical protein